MMADQLAVCDPPFSLDALVDRTPGPSNLIFAWQFFRCEGIDPGSSAGVRRALDLIVATPDLHRFLRESIDPARAFEIGPLHEHCRIVPAAGEFENVLAANAGGHLGAYAREVRPATVGERQQVRDRFERAGPYVAYQLLPGDVPGCLACREYGSHLFTTWFEGVFWDWCLIAGWPDRDLLWVGCLTDTD